jgi:hypothetical protein
MFLSELWAKVRVLLGAVPTLAAAIQGVIVALGAVVVLLPADWQPKAAAVLVLAAGWVTAIVKVVARVTPVPPEAVGLDLHGDQMRVERVGPPFGAGYVPPT